MELQLMFSYGWKCCLPSTVCCQLSSRSELIPVTAILFFIFGRRWTVQLSDIKRFSVAPAVEIRVVITLELSGGPSC